MKRNMLTFLTTITLFGCVHAPNNEETKTTDRTQIEQNISELKDSSFEYLSDSAFNQIKKDCYKWFDSWNWNVSNLNLKDFKVSWEKELSFSWEEYNPNDEYLMKYDTFLIVSSNNFGIDLYSYNTLIELEKSNVIVGFDVDSKVFIDDMENKIRAEIVHSGSYELIEEGYWLDSKKVVLLGYTTEKENIPFIWTIDITTKKQISYSYQSVLKEKRNNYFFVKYPRMKLKME